MKLLAIDTSSVACTVAVSNGDVVTERYEEQAREHTRLLMPMIREVLAESKFELTDLEAIVLGNGPGSFIGMRIAASVSQGLAHGAGLNIIPVSSLMAVAAQVMDESDSEIVAVSQDAHMKEVYLGIYERDESGLPRPIVKERLQRQEAVPELGFLSEKNIIAAGLGWEYYPQFAAANQQFLGEISGVHHPRATYLLSLADTSLAVRPQDIQPAYLRQKVAEKPVPAS